MKTTDELTHEIMEAKSILDYLAENKAEMQLNKWATSCQILCDAISFVSVSLWVLLRLGVKRRCLPRLSRHMKSPESPDSSEVSGDLLLMRPSLRSVTFVCHYGVIGRIAGK